MSALFRQILIVVFMLLQAAAPLVHAHVGNPGDASGLHLAGLEALQQKPKDGAVVKAPQQWAEVSAIVELGSAIHLPKLDSGTALPWQSISHSWPVASAPPTIGLIFATQSPHGYRQPCLGDNPSRAPPR